MLATVANTITIKAGTDLDATDAVLNALSVPTVTVLKLKQLNGVSFNSLPYNWVIENCYSLYSLAIET